VLAARLTLAEAAKLSAVSERTLRRALREPTNPLRHARIGKCVVIAPADLEHWLERHVAPPPPPPGLFDGFDADVKAVLTELCTESAPSRATKRCRGARLAADDYLALTQSQKKQPTHAGIATGKPDERQQLEAL